MRNEIGLTRHTKELLLSPPPPWFEFEEVTERGVTDLIRKYMPDFCYVTAHDLFIMLELVNPDIEYNVVTVTLCNMRKKGEVLYKPWTHPVRPDTSGKKPGLYMRKK